MTPIPEALAGDTAPGNNRDDPNSGDERDERVERGAQDTATQDSVAHTGARRRILVVEDNGYSGPTLCERLRRAGYDAIWAYDVTEAQAALSENQPRVDLLVGDLNLMDSDHATLVREIRGHPVYSGLPIIVISADDQPAKRELARLAGVKEYLAKPFALESLLEAFARWIGAKP